MTAYTAPFFDGQRPLGFKPHWRYIDKGWTRDLRIDFMRGFVFLMLFTAHFPFFSWFALVGWERLGVVSSAEVFILLAGVVTGAVYGKKLASEGLGPCTIKLLARAWTLYKVAALVAVSVALLRLVPGLDTSVLTSFTDPVTGTAYPLYPPKEAGLLSAVLHALVLASAPHQFQVVGLYVVLFLFTPLLFWAISRGKTGALLTLSWALYLVNYFALERIPGTATLRLTVAQFEQAFPVLAWQVLFVHGVALGYHRHSVLEFFGTAVGRALIICSIAATTMLLWFSLNHPLDQLPDWARLTVIPPEQFHNVYQSYFLKYKLGPGRLLNIAVLFVTAFVLLTVFWRPLYRSMGWLFIPLGQESMYVFFVHVYMILLVTNTGLATSGGPWLHTAVLATALLLSWCLVKVRFLFRWLPH
ncbi:OpgC domain-containing protein [Noviherbaspirillum malthae]|jgi:hypothetical protein|uniref:OpgC domain-containing protein n=1 Tax=Noviherbaspirillum malthae TaxID=1260987 RepID=UPI00188E22BD|nr:OpgC domain-containing protein [Noviherbaspirillum malthae]